MSSDIVVLEPEQLRKLYIGGLDYKTNEESLKAHFGQWGEIVDCEVMKDPHTKKSRGFGFVTFKHSKMVDLVQATRPHEVDGRQVEPKRAIPRESSEGPEQLRKLFIGHLDYKTTKETLQSYFEQWGEVTSCVVKTDPETRMPRGFGFVVYKHSYMVDDAQAARPHNIDGCEVESKRPFVRKDSGKPEAQVTVKKVFVSGINDDDSEAALKEYFDAYGKVIDVNIITQRSTGNRRGFAFVEFDDYDPVDKIVLHRHVINGRTRDVKKALSRLEMDAVKRKKEIRSYRRNRETRDRDYNGYNGHSSWSRSTSYRSDYASLAYYSGFRPYDGGGPARARSGFRRSQGPYSGSYISVRQTSYRRIP